PRSQVTGINRARKGLPSCKCKRSRKQNAPYRNCTTKNSSVAGLSSAAQSPANIRCEVNEIDGCNRETRRKRARLPILFSRHAHSVRHGRTRCGEPVQRADILPV